MDKFEKQLKKLLNDDIDGALDGLPDEGEEPQIQEMVPIVYEQKESGIVISEDNPDLTEDYTFARSNLYGLIGRSNAALDLVLRIAQMSEHPRAVEVAANLIKTSSDVTKTLIDLQKNINDSKPKEKKSPINNTQINNYYNNDIEKELDDLEDDLS